MTAPPPGEVLHSHAEPIGEQEMVTCARLTGERGTRPLGIAFVLALRTLMSWGALPGGAIMLGHRAVWREPLRPGVAYETTLRIVERDRPRSRYQRVVLGYATVAPAGGPVLDQRQETLWPRGG
jgi:hypothetical protein